MPAGVPAGTSPCRPDGPADTPPPPSTAPSGAIGGGSPPESMAAATPYVARPFSPNAPPIETPGRSPAPSRTSPPDRGEAPAKAPPIPPGASTGTSPGARRVPREVRSDSARTPTLPSSSGDVPEGTSPGALPGCHAGPPAGRSIHPAAATTSGRQLSPLPSMPGSTITTEPADASPYDHSRTPRPLATGVQPSPGQPPTVRTRLISTLSAAIAAVGPAHLCCGNASDRPPTGGRGRTRRTGPARRPARPAIRRSPGRWPAGGGTRPC